MHLGVIGILATSDRNCCACLGIWPLTGSLFWCVPGARLRAKRRSQKSRPDKPAKLSSWKIFSTFLEGTPEFGRRGRGPRCRENLRGERVLRSGTDLVVVSIGALADEALHETLLTAAQTGGARMILSVRSRWWAGYPVGRIRRRVYAPALLWDKTAPCMGGNAGG